jgi:hypothetical protein
VITVAEIIEGEESFKIQEIVNEAYRLDEEIKNKSIRLNELKIKIHEYFNKLHIKTLRVEREDAYKDKFVKQRQEHINVNQIERVQIIYNTNELKKKLNKNIFNKIVNTKYYIQDYNGLINLLKQYGIKPSQFKQFINPEYEVDKEAINQAYQIGEIKKDDLKGCYELKIVKSLKFTKA